jgi:hypothetical protein
MFRTIAAICGLLQALAVIVFVVVTVSPPLRLLEWVFMASEELLGLPMLIYLWLRFRAGPWIGPTTAAFVGFTVVHVVVVVLDPADLRYAGAIGRLVQVGWIWALLQVGRADPLLPRLNVAVWVSVAMAGGQLVVIALGTVPTMPELLLLVLALTTLACEAWWFGWRALVCWRLLLEHGPGPGSLTAD